ncbi:MAG: phage tail sheath subtilisin-like domain-containing protein [Myxococcales bacterium]|nr:phage tail sheath subtilisin-like domain-containing protein [Myxococcales bacterium]
MPIALDLIPLNFNVPGVYVEFNNKNAVQGTPAQPHVVLLVGTRLSAGTVAELIIKPITSPTQGETYFGRGSMLGAMCKAFKQVNANTEVYAIALNEDAGGAKATATVTITGLATEAGTLNFIWGGVRVAVPVAKGDTASAIAANIKVYVDLETDNPTTTAVLAGVVTASCRWKGATGNSLAIALNYYTGQKTPAGVGVTITAFSGGTTDPDMADLVAALGGDTQYHSIVTPYTDDANMDVLETELESRWGPMRAIEGHAFAALRSNHTDAITYGDARNSPFSTVLATSFTVDAPWIWAAIVCAIESKQQDPARPRQNLKLPFLRPPLDTDRFTKEERNLLAGNGMSIYTVTAGDCILERLVTTYQVNEANVADPSYKDIETMRTLSYLRYSLRLRFLLRYPNYKLGNDGESFGPGQPVITPKLARGEIKALFREWNLAALVEDAAQFDEQLLVERDPNNPNQILAYIPPNLVNQFRTMGAQIGFIL